MANTSIRSRTRARALAVSVALISGALPAATLLAQEMPAQPGAEAVQQRVWVQVEANSSREESVARARAYEERVGSVSGFDLPSGWHAVVLGPFETRDDANEVRRQLQSEGLIPRDAFATEGQSFGTRFFPPGAGEVPMPALPAAESDPAADPEPEIADTAPEVIPEPEPEIAEPVIEEPPEETLAEAQASERTLTRDERAALQVALQWFGYYNLGIDAAFGPGTRRAMTAWQEDRGHDATGVLTTRQREQLIREYSGELAALGMEEWRDEEAGIDIELPLAMVEFDRHEAPFAHFTPVDDSGVRVLLISQSGSQATLGGLYEIMQTLDIVPLEGARSRQNNSFTLTGQSDELRSHTVARHQNGQIKGFTLVWTPERDEQMERVLPMMEASFSTFGGTLPDGIGEASAVSRRDLLAGLSVRRPERSRSGFYIDATGSVLTSAEAVAGCARVTIDEAYNARVVASDDALGFAVLEPETPLVPLAFAQFADDAPRPGTEVFVSGFGLEDVLARPLLTTGALEDLRGLDGEEELLRLGIEVAAGDSGGPVFNGNGAVIGMLLPRGEDGARILPQDVHFAASAEALRSMLSDAGVRTGTLSEAAAMPPGLLTRAAGDLTVMVSCWN